MFSCRHGIVFFFLITSVCGCFEQKSTSDLMLEANQQFAEKQFSTAEITLKKIIKADPQFAKARVLLGEIYLASERFDFAEKELLKALGSSAEKSQISLKLAQVYLKVGKDKEAISLLADIEFEDESSHLLSFILTGKAYINLGDKKKAREAFDEAISLNSGATYSLYGAALKAAMMKNFALASNFLDSTLEKNDNLAEAWILKARLAESTQDYVAANQAYTEFLKVKPDAHSIKLYMANNFLLLNDIENSELLADELLQLNPNQLTANLLKARIALERKNYSLVIEHAEVALKVFPNNPLALYLSGLSHYFKNNYAQAHEKLLHVTSIVSKQHPSHRYLMLTMLKLGKIDKLTEAIAEYEGFYPHESETLSDFASKLSVLGQSEASLALLEKALNIKPDNIQVKTKLGILKLLRRDERGLEDLKSASSESAEDSAANFALTTAYLIKNEPEKAKDTINTWLENHPDDVDALLLKAQILQALQMPKKSIDTLKKANTLKPNQAKILIELAQQLFLQAKYQQAEKVINDALTIAADSRVAYDLLFKIKIALKEKEQFLVELAKIATTSPERQWPRVILAQQSLLKREPEQALEWLSSLDKLNNISNDYFVTLLNSYFLLNDKNQINSIAAHWQKLSPTNLQSYTLQIELLEKLKDIEMAMSVVKLARAQDNLENNAILILQEVRYAITLGRMDGLDTLILKMKQRLPNNAQALYLSGLHALMNKHNSTAKRELQASFALNEDPKTALLLAKAYQDTENVYAAISFLEQTPVKLKNHLLIQKYLAELYMIAKPEAAEKLYVDLVKREPNDVVILNNLAVINTKNGNVVTALEFARKAQQLSPRHPEILDTLGVALMYSKQHDNAVEVLQQAYNIDKSSDIARHYAQALTLTDQQEVAESVLTRLSLQELELFHDEMAKLTLN